MNQHNEAFTGATFPIVVAGMHRSGTSLVASFLRNAGLDMGSRLVGPSRGNPLGHFENADFVQFHQRQLVRLGLDDAGWIAPKPLTPVGPAQAEAHAIVEKNARPPSWGWKDPRTTFFLDFWLRIIPDTRFVFIYREPAEVVSSLFRRGDEAMRLSTDAASRAWLAHNRILLEFARENRSRCVVANIRAIVKNPGAFLQIVAGRLGADIDTAAESPYRSGMLHTDDGSPLPTLLRHFVPECAPLFDALETESDLPGGAEIGGAAPEAFFEYWQRTEHANTEPI